MTEQDTTLKNSSELAAEASAPETPSSALTDAIAPSEDPTAPPEDSTTTPEDSSAAPLQAATKKTSERKKSLFQRKPLYFLMTLVLAVVVITAGVIIFQKWWNNRPGPDPASVQITAVVEESSQDISPYQTCAFGEECVQKGEISRVMVNPDDTLDIKVPSIMQRADVSVLAIYDNPAANNENIIGTSEEKNISIPGSRGEAQLQLVEIKSVLLGTDAQGEETPVSVVWSMRTGDKPLSTSNSPDDAANSQEDENNTAQDAQ